MLGQKRRQVNSWRGINAPLNMQDEDKFCSVRRLKGGCFSSFEIRAAQLPGPLESELIDDQKLVLLGIVEVDQLDVVGFDFVAVAVFDRNPFEEEFMEGAVVVDENRGFRLGDGQSRFFEGGEGDVRVDLLQGGKQAAGQHRLLVVATLARHSGQIIIVS